MSTPLANYTWAQFKAQILALLPIDARRKGVGGSAELYLQKLILQALVRLQTAFDTLRQNHESIYNRADFVQEGCALRAVKPPCSVLRGVLLVKTHADGRCERFPTRLVAWEDRFSLIYRKTATNGGTGSVCIDPSGETFYVYPVPEDDQCWYVSVFWDGLKYDWVDEEQVTFDDAVADACALFCKFRLAYEVERDAAIGNQYERQFNDQKAVIAVREKEKLALLETNPI